MNPELQAYFGTSAHWAMKRNNCANLLLNQSMILLLVEATTSNKLNVKRARYTVKNLKVRVTFQTIDAFIQSSTYPALLLI